MMSALPSYGSLRACNGTKSQPLPSPVSAASPTNPKPVEARRKRHGIEAALVGNLGGNTGKPHQRPYFRMTSRSGSCLMASILNRSCAVPPESSAAIMALTTASSTVSTVAR